MAKFSICTALNFDCYQNDLGKAPLRFRKLNGARVSRLRHVLHDGILPAGCFGSWRLGCTVYWRHNSDTQVDYEALKKQKIDRKARKAESERKTAQRQLNAAKASAVVYSNASPHVDPNHLYLRTKHVKPCRGMRQVGNTLVIPVIGANRKIQSIQFISPNGVKRFMVGGKIKGGFFTVGSQTSTIYLAEGWSTAVTIRGATNCGTVICFNAGNIKSVALALRKKYPNQYFVVAADNDRFTPGNPGLTMGREAAEAAGMDVTWPIFPPGSKGTDFNDLMLLEARGE